MTTNGNTNVPGANPNQQSNRGCPPRWLIGSIGVLFLLSAAGCGLFGIRTLDEDEVYKPLEQPEKIEVSGTFSHEPSGMAFPETVGKLKREILLRYDRNGFDVSAGYELPDTPGSLDVTVYVFPDPRHHNIRQLHPGTTLTPEERKGKLTKQFQKEQQSIEKRHARYLTKSDTGASTLYPDQQGKKASYRLKRRTQQGVVKGQSIVHLYLSAEGWFLKFRVTYTDNLREQADEQLNKLASELGFP